MIFKNYKVNDTNDTNVKVNVKVKVSQKITGPIILIALIL